MSTTQFIFDNEQLNRLFPYYILFNKDFSIKSCGISLSKIMLFNTQSTFAGLFKIAGQANSNLPVEQYAGKSIKLNLINHPEINLEGNLEYLPGPHEYLFTGNIAPGHDKAFVAGLHISSGQQADTPAYNINFYERVLNEVPADIVVFDTNHTYQFLNASAIKDPVLRKWMIGKTDEDYCKYRNKPMSMAAERHAHFMEVLQTKKIKTWEERSVNQDGTVSYLLRNFYPALDEQKNVAFIIGYGIDITDRKRVEEQVKINEKRYRDLYNFSPALIFTHDAEGKILSVNPAICNVLGYKSEEIVGKNMRLLLPPADQDRIQFEYLNKVNTAGVGKGVFRINHKNGATKYLFYQNYKVSEDDAPPYIIGFSQDMTERIKTEKELLLAKHNTENMAKVKDTFLANMSHEIRTPMNGILGVTNLLAKTNLDEQQSNYANLISDSVNNLLTIINDILDMEKISSGKIKFEIQPFKIVDKIKSVIHSFQYKAEQKDLELIFNNTLPANLIVIGDQYRLAQILTNLLGNAVKFTKMGSISLNLSLIHYSETDVIIEFIIKDTGIGISKNRIDFIFDPFVKATSNFNSKFGGTGLGLSICKSLIEIQGGSIRLNSKLKEGSTFTFNLPYKRGSLQTFNEVKGVVVDLDNLNKKILVAEDIELNQFLVKTTLESWGCTVEIAANGKEAVKKVKENNYDLILMDIRMPEMDGITATRLIRELPQKDKAAIPIVAFTANALQGDSKVYKDAGMNDYIIKPYTEEKLHEKITKVLKKHAGNYSDATPEVYLSDDNTDNTMPDAQENNISAQTKLYDISMLESISKNNSSFIEKMLVMFVDVVGADFIKLQEAADNHNREEAGHIAHKMKSTFGNLGVTTLLPYVLELEKGTEDQLPLVIKLGEGLDQVFTQLKNDFPDYFKN